MKSVERLPPHAQPPTFTDDLTIDGLASQIYMTMSGLEHDDDLDFVPRANQLLGTPSLLDYTDPSPSPSPASSLTPSLHLIQGCHAPQIHQTKFSPRKGPPRNTRQDTPNRQRGPRPQPNPTHRKRPFNPNITCDACKRRGHVAATCDQLAMALWIVKYLSNTANASTCASVEDDWVKKHSENLGKDALKPRQIMRTYLDLLHLEETDLDDQLDWDNWDPDGKG